MNENLNSSKTGLYSNDNGVIKAYFQFYSKLSNQQNMLQDYVRTSTYYQAITSNESDFSGKTVMDFGTGSGILAMFSVIAGANKVYAIEASDAVNYAKTLFNFHGMDNKVILINHKIEDINTNDIEKVDTIVSEPLGIMLINERMLEGYLLARDKFLKPGGRMYPSSSVMYFMPFSDETLYKEQINKVNFWANQNFFGLNMTCLKEAALNEKLRQPVIDVYDPAVHVCDNPYSKVLDFESMKCEELLEFNVEFEFIINQASIVHGISSWFDAIFKGTDSEHILSTSPYNNVTHWYQIRLLFPEPIAVNKKQILKGNILFKSNTNQSYFIFLRAGIPELNIWVENSYDLKDPDFRGFGSNYKPPQTNMSK